MTILCLTMNPALDLFTVVDRVQPAHKLRCGPALMHPGGGGINVARVVHRLGGEVLALYLAGGLTGQTLGRLLTEEGLPGLALPIAGETRESFTAHETASMQDYRFVLPGPMVQAHEWQACLDHIAALPSAPSYLVASGSLPPGVPVDFYARLARLAQQCGIRLVLDSSGPALAAALEVGVFLFKPSLRELSELTGQTLDQEADWHRAASGLVRDGTAQLVALSLGEQGALLASADRVLRSAALPVAVNSTIGAGDSFVGGLVAGLCRGLALDAAFALAMAASAAALRSSGTALCDALEVQRLLPQVVIGRLN